MAFTYLSFPNWGHTLPTGNERAAEEGREDPKRKVGITSTGKPCLALGFQWSLPHIPHSVLTQEYRVSPFCSETKQDNSCALQPKSEEVRIAVLSLQPLCRDIQRNNIHVALNVGKFHLLPLISSCMPGLRLREGKLPLNWRGTILSHC